MRSDTELDSMALSLRHDLGEDAISPVDIFLLARSIDNLTLVFYPMGENISGMCIKGHDSDLIAVNSEMSKGRQRFTLAHEFYHLHFDPDIAKSVCAMSLDKTDEREKEADIFASHLLLPSAALYNVLREKRQVTEQDVVRLEQYFGLSRQAMLFRLKKEGKISSSQYGKLSCGVRESAIRYGYDTSLYEPTPASENTKTYGHYIRVADQLLEKEIISEGKYESLLLDAFRDDIVYGEAGDAAEEEHID